MFDTIGQRISFFMKKNGITNIEMADVLGLSSSYIAKFRTDKRRPNSYQISAIAKKLNVSVDSLLGNDSFSVPFYANILDENSSLGINLMNGLNNINFFAISNQWSTISGINKGDTLIFKRVENDFNKVTQGKIYLATYKNKEVCVGRLNNGLLCFDNGLAPVQMDDNYAIIGRLIRLERHFD